MPTVETDVPDAEAALESALEAALRTVLDRAS